MLQSKAKRIEHALPRRSYPTPTRQCAMWSALRPATARPRAQPTVASCKPKWLSVRQATYCNPTLINPMNAAICSRAHTQHQGPIFARCGKRSSCRQAATAASTIAPHDQAQRSKGEWRHIVQPVLHHRPIHAPEQHHRRQQYPCSALAYYALIRHDHLPSD
jgi:hypothetical protein